MDTSAVEEYVEDLEYERSASGTGGIETFRRTVGKNG